ncbi:MAG: glycerate kinase [Lentisphaeria bacterium]|nr:glycerate kinase [Lentisphaeria bacterium]
MKLVLAPDSFKGNMRSIEVCQILEAAFAAVLPDLEIIAIPMADGGEGTTEALVAAMSGALRSIRVHGPLGEMVDASYALVDGGRLAVMEMAAASGMELLASSQLDPMRTSTYGTGEMIRDCLGQGTRDIVLGIGGSATVDGGVGMAQALGFRFLDADGRELGQGGSVLSRIARIDANAAEPRLAECTVRVACDVTNPLTGADGAARVFGPQKGATPEMVEDLESGLANLQRVWERQGMLEKGVPGDGAAGGLGAGLRAFCGARLESGARLVADVVGLRAHLKGADILVTGEGCTDGQTAAGKLCAVLADIAREEGVRSLLISGALRGDLAALNERFDYALATSVGECDLEAAIRNGRNALRFTATNAARLLAACEELSVPT